MDGPTSDKTAPVDPYEGFAYDWSEFRTGSWFYDTDKQKIYLEKLLGEGSFGQVRKAVKDGKEFAVKILRTHKLQGWPAIQREIQITEAIKGHKHVADFLGVVKLGRCRVLKVELCGETLLSRLYSNDPNRQTEAVKQPLSLCAMIGTQVYAALEYLHSKNVSHNDLSPNNICFSLADKNCLKLIDFGSARFIPDKVIADPATALVLRAPENIFFVSAGFETDVWAAAVTISECFMGRLPFEVDSDIHLSKVLRHLQLGGTPDYMPPDLMDLHPYDNLREHLAMGGNNTPTDDHHQFVELLCTILKGDPKLRPTAAQCHQKFLEFGEKLKQIGVSDSI